MCQTHFLPTISLASDLRKHTPRTSRTSEPQRTPKNNIGPGTINSSEVDELLHLIEEALLNQISFTTENELSDKYQGPLWTFVWSLKGDKRLRAADALEVFALCTEGIQILQRRRGDFTSLDPWSAFIDDERLRGDFQDSEEAFVSAWGAMKWPRGFDPVYQAVEEAVPIVVPGETRHFHRVLGVLERISALAGSDDSFFLSQAKLADLLGFDRVSVGKIMARICNRGFLRRIRCGSSASGASEYRLVRAALPSATSTKVCSIDKRTA